MSLKRVLAAHDLTEEALTGGATQLFRERCGGMFQASVEKFTTGHLDRAIEAYGLSCYLQGVADAAQVLPS